MLSSQMLWPRLWSDCVAFIGTLIPQCIEISTWRVSFHNPITGSDWLCS